MKTRAWVSATIQTHVEWDEKNELGYVDALREKLKVAGIAEFFNSDIESGTKEYECEECYEFKPGHEFKEKSSVCDDCVEERKREKAEETDDRDDLRDR